MENFVDYSLRSEPGCTSLVRRADMSSIFRKKNMSQTKEKLKQDWLELHFLIEREAVQCPENYDELRKEVKALKERCRELDIDFSKHLK